MTRAAVLLAATLATHAAIAPAQAGMTGFALPGAVETLAIANPSFEADHFGVSPGIATPNGGITGWSHSGNAGQNPVWTNPSVPSGPSYPFWDNGAAPHGQQVALLQNLSTLSQMVPGFQAGRHYVLTYHENGRQLRQIPDDPRLRVLLGGAIIVPDHPVPSVEAQGTRATPFPRVVANVFTAPADGPMELRLEAMLDGGVTLLLDQFSIFRVDDPATITPTFPMVQQLVVLNPSFEADAYGNAPGYASGNGGTIASWSFTGNVGVNPTYADPVARTGPSNPFADNAIVEDGQQVAFIQNVGTLSQSINGFRAGRRYRVTYHENGRFNQGIAWPWLEVRLGGEIVVSPHEAAAMNTLSERTLPYVYVESAPFVAPSDGAHLLEFRTLEPNAVAVLLDNVRVVELED